MRVSRIQDPYLDQQNPLRRAWLQSLVKMYRQMIEECVQFRKKAQAFPYGSPGRLENMAIDDELSDWVSNLGNAEV
jgi:hypothetical protein